MIIIVLVKCRNKLIIIYTICDNSIESEEFIRFPVVVANNPYTVRFMVGRVVQTNVPIWPNKMINVLLRRNSLHLLLLLLLV